MQEGEMVTESLMAQILDLWNEATTKLDIRFDVKLESVPMDGRKVISSENSNTLIGSLDGNTIYLSEDVIEGKIPLSGAVAMICFQSAFITKSICHECIEDLAFEFGRQFVLESEQDNWLELWAENQTSRDISIRHAITPSNDLPKITEMGGEMALSIFVRELDRMSRYEIPFEVEDYVTFLSERFRKFTAKLTKTELKLIDRVLHHNSTDLSILSSEVGVSPQWISRKITELGKKGILSYTSFVPFSKIGIRMFHLFAHVNELDVSITKHLSTCPFVYSYRRIIAGNHQIFALVTIPDNPQNIRGMRKGIELLSNLGVSIDLLEVVSSGITTCLDHYDSSESKWNIPWGLLGIELQKIERDNLAGLFPRCDVIAKLTESHIDELDLKILEFARTNIISVGIIRKQFKIGQEKARLHLSKLRNNGLIAINWYTRHIGLNESVIITTSDEHTGSSIVAWSQRLPYCVVSYVSDDRIVLRAELPSGGGHDFSTAIRTIDPSATVNLMGKIIGTQWVFPSELWDVKAQKWKCPEKELSEWLRSLVQLPQ